MSDEKMPSKEQIEHNIKLTEFYPLGQIDSIWQLVENLANYIGRKKYFKEIDELLENLQSLDAKIRADKYPLASKVKKNLKKKTP
jgi:hypothetical protein